MDVNVIGVDEVMVDVVTEVEHAVFEAGFYAGLRGGTDVIGLFGGRTVAGCGFGTVTEAGKGWWEWTWLLSIEAGLWAGLETVSGTADGEGVGDAVGVGDVVEGGAGEFQTGTGEPTWIVVWEEISGCAMIARW